MRSELERFGGTVEKFIGDAVMAVFGAPVAGEQHLAERRAAEADAHLRDAIAFFRPLGATAYVRQAEELLVGAGLEIPA